MGGQSAPELFKGDELELGRSSRAQNSRLPTPREPKTDGVSLVRLIRDVVVRSKLLRPTGVFAGQDAEDEIVWGKPV